MKTVWAVCAALCFLGLVCSGGLFFSGRSLLGRMRDASNGGAAFALMTVKAVGKSWDRDELTRRVDPAARQNLVDSVIAAGQPLGGLLTAGPFAATAIAESRGGGPKQTTVTAVDKATFEHGQAKLRLIVVLSDDQWRVRDFEIGPLSAPAGTKN